MPIRAALSAYTDANGYLDVQKLAILECSGSKSADRIRPAGQFSLRLLPALLRAKASDGARRQRA
jgi:hypothetical protein